MNSKLKILIAGDSFAADWTVKYPDVCGWPNMLAQKHYITNIAQAGVSEYKIWKQLQSINIDSFDWIIISHTSPYRVTTRWHPIHYNDNLHNSADLIYSDIEYHSKKIKNFFNWSLRSANLWFKHHFCKDYQEDIYKILFADINKKIKTTKSIQISNLTDIVSCDLNYNKYLQSNQGLANHFDNQINQKIYNDICSILENNI